MKPVTIAFTEQAFRVLREATATTAGAKCTMYESDGVLCSADGASPRTVLFDKNGAIWSGFGVWHVRGTAMSHAAMKKFNAVANHGPQCS